MASKQNLKRIDDWKAGNIDRIVIQPRKGLKLPQRLQSAVEGGNASSKQEYIIKAIQTALDRDGISGE